MTFYQLVNLLNNLLHHTAHNSSHVYSFPRQAFFWYQILQLRERKKMQKSSPQPPSPLYSPHHQCNLSQPSPLVDINCNLSSSFSTSSISFFFFPFRHHLSHLEIYMNFWRIVGSVIISVSLARKIWYKLRSRHAKVWIWWSQKLLQNKYVSFYDPLFKKTLKWYLKNTF